MRLLLVKTSSLGDVIHNLPVVTDIFRHFPGAKIDWCVEESFAAIPKLHPGVAQVIPVAVRRWRKKLLQSATWREIGAFRRAVQQCDYDLVLDTQGLAKSALIARQARGPLAGYAADSAREPLAARFYDRHYRIDKALHAVERNRRLAAAALGYSLSETVDYGIHVTAGEFAWLPTQPYIVLLTATSRDDKLWPEDHWVALGCRLSERGLTCVLPGGSAVERERASRLAGRIDGAVAAPPMRIDELASLLAGARGAVGVDTGLTHLAVALKTPTVAIYTATEPGLTGVYGAGYHRNLGGKAQVPAIDSVLSELLEGL